MHQPCIAPLHSIAEQIFCVLLAHACACVCVPVCVCMHLCLSLCLHASVRVTIAQRPTWKPAIGCGSGGIWRGADMGCWFGCCGTAACGWGWPGGACCPGC